MDAEVDTLVVGGGQAGLAMSYWLGRAGVAHQVLDRRAALGGAWQDRWVDYFRHYAEAIGAPVRTGTDVTRIAPADGGTFDVETTQGGWRARNVVLATGGFQTAKIPALSSKLPGHILQLHTNEYRNRANCRTALC